MTGSTWLLALLARPLRAEPGSGTAVARAVEQVGLLDPGRVAELLHRHLVDRLWLRAVEERGLAGRAGALVSRLRAARAGIVGRCLLREAWLDRAAGALAARTIPFVVFKGAHLAYDLYGDPLLRPSADADLLVAAEDRQRAVEALRQAGFAGDLAAHSRSHEIALRGFGVEIDLHWQLFRPGRACCDLARRLVASRRPGSRWPVPGHAETLVTLLLHTAVTEHVTGHLIRAVDIDRWVRRHPDLWEEAGKLLGETGLATGAWATLTWVRGLLGTPVPPAVVSALAPGIWRRCYLEGWLAAQPSEIYQRRPNLVRLGFSLALQDRPGDALRALGGWWRAGAPGPLTERAGG